MNKPIELGCAGHLLVARWCAYRRHTQVGAFRVSTVGDYYPATGRGEESGPRTTIGAGADSFFETLVFRTTDKPASDSGCGCREVVDWSEIDGERYATAGEAQTGHERYVTKYLQLKENQ